MSELVFFTLADLAYPPFLLPILVKDIVLLLWFFYNLTLSGSGPRSSSFTGRYSLLDDGKAFSMNL